MIEFGSDFHCCNYSVGNTTFPAMIGDANYYATGRQAIQDLILHNHWHCIWMPTYFCYNIIEVIKSTGIVIQFYDDYPLANDLELIKSINFAPNDVLFRMNFYGLRGRRSNQFIPIPVIEDHSHDLIGDWAVNSDADWCIASLRKTLPISEGGVLWSPKNNELPPKPVSVRQNDLLASRRNYAMHLKRDFITGHTHTDKSIFRNLFIQTEMEFDTLPIAAISVDSKRVVDKLDIFDWYAKKRDNWEYLYPTLTLSHRVLTSENNACNVFSSILLLDTQSDRDKFRLQLIAQNIYPSILWQIPLDRDCMSLDFSNRMLSIHCDARYSLENMQIMKNLMKQND